MIYPFKRKNEIIHHTHLCHQYNVFSCVCVYLCWQSWVKMCLLLSGSSNQPSDEGSHYFGVIRLQVAKQPFLSHREQNMRGREWLLMIISVCVKQKPKGNSSFTPKSGIWQQLHPCQSSLCHFSLLLFLCVWAAMEWFLCTSVSVKGDWCSWRVAASSDWSVKWGKSQKTDKSWLMKLIFYTATLLFIASFKGIFLYISLTIVETHEHLINNVI